MPRGVIPIRGSDDEHALWKEVAALEGLRFSAWARRALNEEADRVKAERSENDSQKVERVELRNTAFPQGKKSYEPDFRT